VSIQAVFPVSSFGASCAKAGALDVKAAMAASVALLKWVLAVMNFIRSRSFAACISTGAIGNTRRVPIGMQSRNRLNFQALWIAGEVECPVGSRISLKKQAKRKY
jgi:hypothetical protein